MIALTKQCYAGLFSTPYFPFWFIAQAAWSCDVAFAAASSSVRAAILAFVLTFSTREFLARLLGDSPPLLADLRRVSLFAAIALAWAFVPRVYRDRFLSWAFPVPVLHAFVQLKTFTLCIRAVRGALASLGFTSSAIVGLFVSLLDTVIAWAALCLPGVCVRLRLPHFDRRRLPWIGARFLAESAAVMVAAVVLDRLGADARVVFLGAAVLLGALSALAVARVEAEAEGDGSP
jgi:hypothetical protein